MHTSNPVYMFCKISFFIFKFGVAGLNQAKLADLWLEGDFSEHVDRIWSVYYDWGLIGISGEMQGIFLDLVYCTLYLCHHARLRAWIEIVWYY